MTKQTKSLESKVKAKKAVEKVKLKPTKTAKKTVQEKTAKNVVKIVKVKNVKAKKGKLAKVKKGVPFILGRKYLVRTVTNYALGELVEVYENHLVLKDACWVADTGRFSHCLKNGTVSEAEPFFNDAIIERSAIVDTTEWDHKLIFEAI